MRCRTSTPTQAGGSALTKCTGKPTRLPTCPPYALAVDEYHRMTVTEFVQRLGEFEPDDTAFWHGETQPGPTTEVIVVRLPEDDSAPDPEDELRLQGWREFLMVELAQDACEVYASWHGVAEPSLEQKVRAVVHYSEHDAYLDET